MGIKKKEREKDPDLIGCTCSFKPKLTLSYQCQTVQHQVGAVPKPPTTTTGQGTGGSVLQINQIVYDFLPFYDEK